MPGVPESAKSELLIVGNDGGTNVGGSFLRGARQLGIEARLVPMRDAMDAPALLRQVNWRVRGRRPTHLKSFSDRVVAETSEFRPTCLLTTGLAPLTDQALEEIGRLGTKRLNFLTDDPWNPAHRASWFLKALPHYDHVFSPRRANHDDLAGLGCRQVHYLPFGYDNDLFRAYPVSANGRNGDSSDVVFAGGADDDRAPYFIALSDAGINVSLYGDYWHKWKALQPFFRGYADPPALCKIIGKAKVSVCLVRRANRDGHSMRTFELPAVGSCMLVEDTLEHREIFGEDGEAVIYFTGVGEMISKTHWLLGHEIERRRLANSAHQLVTGGKNTYRDRLASMLDTAGAS